MKKKIIALLLSFQLSYSFTVTDPASYVYFMEQIAQMTEVIQGITKQIETLGGIRTALDETKRVFYDTKSNLEGAFSNLQDALKDLREATSNAEIKSLFDFSEDSISTNSTDGILYKDITQEIQSYFDSADEALLKRFDKAKLVAFDEEMKKINQALKANSLEEFNVDLQKIDYNKISKNILLRDQLRKIQGDGKKGFQNLALRQNNDIWNKYFLPTEEQEEQRKQRQEKVEKYISYIEQSSDMYQQAQTTNMILAEILTVLNDEYKSAITFRNAMALLYLDNSDNTAFITQLKKIEKLIQNFKKVRNQPLTHQV